MNKLISGLIGFIVFVTAGSFTTCVARVSAYYDFNDILISWDCVTWRFVEKNGQPAMVGGNRCGCSREYCVVFSEGQFNLVPGKYGRCTNLGLQNGNCDNVGEICFTYPDGAVCAGGAP